MSIEDAAAAVAATWTPPTAAQIQAIARILATVTDEAAA